MKIYLGRVIRMTVAELASHCGFASAVTPCPDRVVSGGYCGDLLSWVMGRASADSAWITIMSNVNVAAVAALADVACVILAEGEEPDVSLLEAAEGQGINLLLTELNCFEAAVAVGKCI